MDSNNKLFKTEDNLVLKFFNFCWNVFDKPVVWLRETVVVPNRKEYYWYHRRYNRVPTVDECYASDEVCIYEADLQWERDKLVDMNILHILRKRYENCRFEYLDEKHKCKELYEYWQKAIDNYFIKYGDLDFYQKSIGCLMKQKHRMAWERRHGPVGTGKRSDREAQAQVQAEAQAEQ